MKLWRGMGQAGITIIEVTMFLGISGVILAVAQTVFSGQQGRTQFQQGVRDLVSSVQQHVDQVGTGIFLGQGSYDCNISPITGRPVLSTPPTGTSSACIFLGSAFQVLVDSGDVYAYTVLGTRADSQGNAITNLANTSPEPIVNNGTGHDVTLTTDYHFNWGRVVSSNVDWQDGSGPDGANLIGFYNNLTGGASGASGGQSIVAKGYSFTNNSSTSVNSTEVVGCLEESSTAACPSIQLISDWQLCLASSNNSQNALVTFTSAPGGLSSDINFGTCP